MPTKKPPGKLAKRAKNTQGSAKVGAPDVKVFIAEYLIDSNGRRAAIAAGYSPASADSQASRLLKSVKVRAEVDKARARVVAKVEEKAAITLAEVVRELRLIAMTDPREISEYIVGCCRHCYGESFGFQRTVAEFNRDYERWQGQPRKKADEFDTQGGIGFDALRAPNDKCPECAGAGRGRNIVKDTRHFSPGAVALFVGIKQTKDGLQALTHSKMDALEKLMRHLGGYAIDNKQQQPFADALAGFLGQLHQAGGSPLPIRPPAAKT